MRYALLILFLVAAEVRAQGSNVSKSPIPGDQVTPEYENSREGRIPGDNVVPNIDLSKAKGLQEMLNKANREFAEYADRTNGIPPSSGATIPEHPQPQGIEVIPPQEKSIPSGIKINQTKRHFPRETANPQIPPSDPTSTLGGGDTKVFAENIRFRNALSGVETVTLPSNSVASATIEAGVKVRLGTEMRMPVRVDYAFLGPNKTVVEMTGCNAWISVIPDPSTSRICGDKGTLSCRSPTGQTFNLDFKLQIIDQKDNYVCLDSVTVLNGKGMAALAEFGQGAATAFGQAMAAAQVSTQVQSSPEGNVGVTGANVSGDQTKYIAGQTVAGASGKFLNWYADFQISRQPSQEVESGRKIYIAIDGEIQVPKIFFDGEPESTDSRKLNTSDSLMKQVAEGKKGG